MLELIDTCNVIGNARNILEALQFLRLTIGLKILKPEIKKAALKGAVDENDKLEGQFWYLEISNIMKTWSFNVRHV